MSDQHPCYGFTPARHRLDRVQLAPPLRQLARWTRKNVGYVPLVGHGLVFLSFTNGAIAAFDERTADEVWRFPLPHPYVPIASKEGAYLLHDGRVLVFTGEDLAILDARTGDQIARQPAPRLDLWGAVIHNGHLVCQLEADKKLWIASYDLATNQLAWKHPCTRLNALLTANDKTLFYCPEQGTLAARDLITGEQRWTISVEDLGRYVDPIGTPQPGDLVGIRLAIDDLVIAAVQGHHLLALDAATGEQRWLRRLETPNPFNVAYHPSGHLYVSGPKYFNAVDAKTGELLIDQDVSARYKQAVISAPFTSPGVTDGYLYFGEFLKSLIAWSIEKQEIAWTFKCRSRIRMLDAPLALANRLYALDDSGTLYAFEPTN